MQQVVRRHWQPPFGHDPREVLRAVLLATVLTANGVLVAAAQAQENYPNKPIRIVVGFTAGGPADITKRVVEAPAVLLTISARASALRMADRPLTAKTGVRVP